MIGRSKEPYQNLANAIVVLAAKDYQSALRYQKQNPENESVKAYIRKLERFFRSEWYELLTDLDADRLLRRIQEKVEEECDAH